MPIHVMTYDDKVTFNSFMKMIWMMSPQDIHYLDFKARYYGVMKDMFSKRTVLYGTYSGVS